MSITPETLEFANRLALMAEEASRLKLYRTMHRIKDAARECGWDMQDRDMPATERKRMYCNVQGVKDL